MRPPTAIFATALAVCLLAASAPAVQPAGWSHSTEAHFAKGKFEDTVSTSLGEITLARRIKVLLRSDAAPPVVSAVAAAGSTLYAGAGNEPVIYKVQAGKVAKFAKLPSTMIGCLLWTGRELLVGTGGEKAGIYRVDEKGRVRPVWTDEKVKYVWAVLRKPDGGLYAATGAEGKVFAIDKAGKAQVIYHADKLAKNVLCLAAAEDGKLYAGTDEKGLILEIDPRAKTGRVLYDAPEKEIAALVVGAAGELFAATADAAKASAAGDKTPAATKAGKADKTGKKPPATGKAVTRPATGPAAKKPTAKPPEKTKAPDKKPGKPETKPGKKPAKDEGKDKQKDEGKDKDEGKQDEGKDRKPDAESRGEGGSRRGDPTSRPRRSKTPATRRSPVRPGPKAGARPAAAPPRPSAVIRRTTAVRRPPTAARPPAGGQGNAVYMIRPDGLVETIFRRPVTILGMLRRGDKLLLATGNGGGIYRVTTDGDEIALIADTDAKQVTSLALGRGGQILFGTANKGSVGRVEKDFARKGTFVSEALDAKQIAKWGTVQVAGEAAGGSRLTIATRSGNVAEPDEKTWSSWSKEAPLENGFLPIGSPAGRFLQYRLSFASNGRAAAVVRGVDVIYQVGNLAPAVAGVSVVASPKGRTSSGPPVGPKVYRHVTIKAADQNGDKLRFIIAFREVGTEAWITITEKLTAPKFVWDTRGVGDGKYELRVTASDDPSNPAAAALEASRISDPIIVDNTTPAVRNLAGKGGAGTASVTGEATDAGSRVIAIHYAVDSQSDWVALLPRDGICDSNRERFAFEVKDLKPGAHRIAVRAADLFGNVGYGAVTVKVGK